MAKWLTDAINQFLKQQDIAGRVDHRSIERQVRVRINKLKAELKDMAAEVIK